MAGNEARRVIEVEGLTKRWGDVIGLSGVSFSLREAEILGVIGPNGAGKTTLLESLAGLVAHDEGMVRVDGVALPATRRKEAMFYLPDGISPDGELSCGTVLVFYRDVFGSSAATLRETVGRLGLAPVLRKRVQALSKGFRRRLLLAIALLAPQPVLLLDEPFDGLDLRQTLGVMELLREVVRAGRTLVLSIHQLADAERICDRLLLLESGRVLGVGTLAELRRLAGRDEGRLEEVFLALT